MYINSKTSNVKQSLIVIIVHIVKYKQSNMGQIANLPFSMNHFLLEAWQFNEESDRPDHSLLLIYWSRINL